MPPTTSIQAGPGTVNAVVRPRKASSPASSPAPSFADIQTRAYEIYLARGAQPGRDAEDWATAERELRARAIVAR